MKKTFCAAAGLILLSSASIVSADSIKMYGATTTTDIVVTPYKAAVEKATGYTLEVIPRSAGFGLVNLAKGECDIAMTAANLETTRHAAAKFDKTVKLDNLVFTHVMDDEIVFVANPSNPVSELSNEQIKAVYTGKVMNWQEVGGPNMPVMSFSHNKTSATRQFVRESIMNGEAYSPLTKALMNQAQVAYAVADNPAGFAALSKTYVTDKVKILKTVRLARPLAFITRGEPAGGIKNVIEAFKAETSKK